MMNFFRSASLVLPGEPTGLRRADWRFLLPNPDGIFQHIVLIGGPAALPEQLLRNGSARQVSVDFPLQKRSVDALAVFHTARVDLDYAAAYLTTGGSLYIEVDRRSPEGITVRPQKMLKRLEKAGLSPSGVYWAAPDFEHCKRYIPLDIAEPFLWYLSTLYVAGTPQHRLIEIGLRIFTRLRSFRFSSLAPCFAVTAIAGGRNSGISTGSATIGANFPSVLGRPEIPGEVQKPGMVPVLITSGQDDGSRAVILPFSQGSKQPLAAIKISTLPSYNINIDREQSTLCEVRKIIDPGMRRTVPEPLGQFAYGNLIVGMESCAEGKPLFVTSGRWLASFQQQLEDLHLAAEWLCAFHRDTQTNQQPWDEAAHQQWIEIPLRAYAQTFGLTTREECLFNRVRNHSRALLGTPFPHVRMHYDFIPGNIYRFGKEITVIDWEFGGNWHRERIGPAGYDLLFFITYWMHLVYRITNETGEMRGFYQVFLKKGKKDKYADAAHRVIQGYMNALNIDPRFLPLMLVYLWVEQALHRSFRKQSLQIEKIIARAGNRCVLRVGIMAEFANQLFSE